MTIIGALVRVEKEQHDAAWQSLERLPGVTPFALDDATRLGLVIESPTLDDAYRLLNHDVQRAPGVLSAYPAYAHFENEPIAQ